MRVKICGLCRPGDAALAVRAGADLVGVILAPGFQRTRTETEAAAILGSAGHALRVGVFVDAPAAAVATAERLRLDVLQLHGQETPEHAAALKAAGPWRVWKAVRVRGEADLVDALDRFARHVDGLLLDGWSARAEGGTGTCFDWHEVAVQRARLPEACELIVAGGLTPESVPDVVDVLRPDVVDVSSGVESAPGRKSASRMEAFVAAARAAAGSQRPR